MSSRCIYCQGPSTSALGEYAHSASCPVSAARLSFAAPSTPVSETPHAPDEADFLNEMAELETKAAVYDRMPMPDGFDFTEILEPASP